MRIVMISDIHIDVSKFDDIFEKVRVMLLSSEISRQNPDEVWIIGDLLDKARANVETLKLTKEFLDSLGVPVKFVEGNHERLSSEYYTLTQLQKLFGIEKLPEYLEIEGVSIACFGHDVIHQIANSKGADILLSHFRWTHPLYGKGEIFKDEINIKNKFKEVILGDIHSKYSPHSNVRYIRSPYTVKYQTEADTGYIVLDVKNGLYHINPIDTKLPNKIKLTTPVSKLARLMGTLDETNRYQINVELHSRDEFKLLAKVRKPKHVSALRPILVEKEKEHTKKVEIRDNVFDTFISVVEKPVREAQNMIKEILGEM